ncbi:dihydrolipoamide acetyltransferase family protein [Tumebacillus sp. DT12]|uniref:Dihydrolipoamide acetyltransferase component of pyruvate dehydrogenase complex n=1 Tax=Tumebacillus lacus TaxID=2995335 RepID=A0ABT3X9A8_9BACL|nr:dihydrolipoamide acetyltransferase family protein [Tumebacillus lacus]MCX7572200.1 dihydrolipoamide acetyltransferase family protein [Tumebacillus lacus]
MTVAFKLPDVGEGIHEAEIVRWLVNVGDAVREFDPIVEVQTDKALVELPAPASGQVLEIKANAGDLAHVGDVIIVIGEAGTATAGDGVAVAAPVAASPAAGSAATEIPQGNAALAVQRFGRALATPATRKRARELGIDINLVPGSGKAGRVEKHDVERFAAGAVHPHSTEEQALASAAVATDGDAGTDLPAAPAAPAKPLTPAPTLSISASAADERVPLRGLRRTIAQRMVHSAFTAPHVTAFDDVDMTELIQYRKNANELLKDRGVKLTYLPFILKALVSALKQHPFLNAHMDDERGEIVLKKEYNVGIAVDTPDGLMVPVVKNVDKKSILDIAADINALIEKTKSRTLTVEEMKGGTFTISNMGPLGGLFATPILNYPEVGILGVHKIEEKPVVRRGEIVIRSMMNLSLSFDHRVIDGAESVRFTNHMKKLLENPNLLFLEMS